MYTPLGLPALLVWAACVSLPAAHADILQSLFSNTALAASPDVTTAPNINSTNEFPDYVSVRFDGTVSAPSAEFITFSVYSDGVIRLWVDDHLLIEDTSATSVRSLKALFAIPYPDNATTFSLRLEYIHAAGPSVIQLLWSGNTTANAVVPPSALSSFIPPVAIQRQALRDRLYAPALPWQTRFDQSMTTHVQMPSGFALHATLADGSNSSFILGDVFVFRRANPARVLPGPHSYSGDITSVTIQAWLDYNCSVTLQSSMIGVDLVYVATSTGPDCARLVLLLQPAMLWNRAGNINYATAANDSVIGVLPGFPNVTVYATTSTAAFNTSGVYLALPLAADGAANGTAAFSTGSAYFLPAMTAAISTAAAAQAARVAAYGNLSIVYDAMQSVIAWNTIYVPTEGVITPVSRGWNFGDGYVLFEWDTLFLAYMAALEPGTARDISYANAMQIILSRTLDGLVPNWACGLRKSYDRSESQIGAFVIREIFNKTQDVWLVEAVFDALLGWNEWVWRRRRGEGILAPGGELANLMVLGSDPSDPMGDSSTNTMQGARYEGLDNSPMYDSPNSNPPGPVEFNSTTHHMTLYDMGATALYLSDTAALMDLAVVVNRTDVIPQLQVQFNAVQAAMNAFMWNADAGIYSNVLFNGSFYPRYAPSSFFPLLSNSCSDAQADSLAQWLASPEGFCVNATATGVPGTRLMFQWWNRQWQDNAACQTDTCTTYTVTYDYTMTEPEARVLAAPAASTLPLNLYLKDGGHDLALITNTTAPDGYSFVRNEGYCFIDPPTDAPSTNLTLWYNSDRPDYKTCGTAACVASALKTNFVFMGNLCYAYDATTPESWGCQYGVPSIARSDPAFPDNAYWRGRIWGPHIQLVYWGLRAYDHVPSVHAVRQVLVAQGKALVEQEWTWFRHVNENMNGWNGVGSDSSNSDPFYTGAHFPAFCRSWRQDFTERGTA